MEYKGKETFYNGVLFRSKNEAKWARFFSLLRIRYAYEPVTVFGWNGVKYRPDFYFPDYGKYAEVKSNANGIQNDQMAEKLNGAIDWQATDVSNGLLLLGAFPYDVRVNSVRLRTKWLYWYKGVCCADAYIWQSQTDGKATLAFTENNIDTGDPLPLSASPDIYVEPRSAGEYITIAINDTNEYFSYDQIPF
jgi:hypothetical protein